MSTSSDAGVGVALEAVVSILLVILLLVKVSVPARVANVPVVGRVTFVVLVEVKVIA
jgi:hypothetical protein